MVYYHQLETMADQKPEVSPSPITSEPRPSLSATERARLNFLGRVSSAASDAERNRQVDMAVIVAEGPPDHPLTEPEILATFGPISRVGEVEQNQYGIILPDTTSTTAMQLAVRFLQSRANMRVGMGIYHWNTPRMDEKDFGGKVFNKAALGLNSSKNQYPGKVVLVASPGQAISLKELTPEERAKIQKIILVRR